MLKNYALWVVFSAQKWHFWAPDTATKGVNRVEKVPKCDNPSFFSSFNFVSMRLKPPTTDIPHTHKTVWGLASFCLRSAPSTYPATTVKGHALTSWESNCVNLPFAKHPGGDLLLLP